ncbi:ParA family protein [Roseomonas sp. 18066]|uniref:ParA family protein n=1 Tax=Roseomonas sp. 18066 TaxID=2681412 RepID=UPI00135A1B91|nr:ParA family protein [Roseomonas sp. 18066]
MPTRAPKKTERCRIILVSSPKGGVGKSSLVRNILVAAARRGLRAEGIDFDPQGTLHKWAIRRERVRESFPECPEVPVREAELGNWRNALKPGEGTQLLVLDTPPSIEVHYSAALSLCTSADFVLVPTGATQDDVDSVMPWMATLASAEVKAAFILNKANRRTKSYESIRAKLLQGGALCPIEIPLLEDIHVSAGKGLGVLDFNRGRANDTFEALWSYVAREASL